MPQIRTYAAPNLGLQPSETGVEATANAARLGGRLYSQAAAATQELGNETQRFGAETASVGEGVARDVASTIKDVGNTANQYIEHQEISHGATAWAGLNDQLTQAWNDTAKNADPNDPTVAQKFRENVLEPALDKFNQGFLTEGGQRWAETHTESLRNHMFEKTAADMSTLAGTAAALNIHNTATSMSNTAVKDPSSVPHLLDSVDSIVSGVVDSSPNIKGVDAAKAKMDLTQKMRENIVKSGAFGAIQNSANPEAEAAKWAQQYPDLINGQEELQLAKAAKTQARTNLALQKQTQIYQKQIDELNTHKAANDTFNKNVTIDQTTGRPILSPQYFKDALDIAKNNPDAPNAASVAKTMIDWGENQQRTHNEVVQTDPATQKSLLDRVFDPTNPTSTIDVLRAEADHKLSTHDGQVMRQLVEATQGQGLQGPVYKAAIDGAQEKLGFHVGLDDAHTRYAGFMSTFWPEYLRMKAAGTLPPDALDLNNPDSLISKSLKPFVPTPAQLLRAALMRNAQAIPGGMNLTGPNSTITGVSVENAPAFRPPPTWQYSPSRGQYRDPQGKIYDASGKPVK